MKSLTGLIIAVLVCAMAGIGMSGCNTFRGAGRDIQKGGQAVQDAADDAQYTRTHPSMITARAGRGGTISPSGGNRVHHRSGRAFTIRADRGYHVADVLVDGSSVGAVSRYTFDNVTEDHTISAVFTPNPGPGYGRHH